MRDANNANIPRDYRNTYVDNPNYNKTVLEYTTTSHQFIKYAYNFIVPIKE